VSWWPPWRILSERTWGPPSGGPGPAKAGPHVMPDTQAEAIRRTLMRHDAWHRLDARAAARKRRTGWAPAAGVCVILAAAGAIVFTAFRQPVVTLEAATEPESAIERLARSAHERAVTSDRPHLVSSSRMEVVQWVRQRTALSLSLADRRGRPDDEQFVLEGASIDEDGPMRVGAVSYRVDGQRVTLLTAHEQFVPQSVRWSLAVKRIQHRVDPTTGVSTMMWANSGQAYVLVSSLPGNGERACLVCHADGRRDAVIASLGR
jgi:hypothetical protein